MKQMESSLSETHQSSLVFQAQLHPGALLRITTSRDSTLTVKIPVQCLKSLGKALWQLLSDQNTLDLLQSAWSRVCINMMKGHLCVVKRRTVS